MDGDTLLIWACREGELKVVEVLVRAGAEKEAKTVNGSTPLAVAGAERHLTEAEGRVRGGEAIGSWHGVGKLAATGGSGAVGGAGAGGRERRRAAARRGGQQQGGHDGPRRHADRHGHLDAEHVGRRRRRARGSAHVQAEPASVVVLVGRGQRDGGGGGGGRAWAGRRRAVGAPAGCQPDPGRKYGPHGPDPGRPPSPPHGRSRTNWWNRRWWHAPPRPPVLRPGTSARARGRR